MLEYRILGPLEVVEDGRLLSLGGPKQRATLAILLLNANRVVSIDRIADDLYAGSPPVTAVTQVQRQISDLRKALGDASAIETRPPGYVIRLEPDHIAWPDPRHELHPEDLRHQLQRVQRTAVAARKPGHAQTECQPEAQRKQWL